MANSRHILLHARLSLLLLFGLLLLSSTVTASSPVPSSLYHGRSLFRSVEGLPLDAPYIATHDQVVTQILALAELRDGDILYDLGCGDGRIVVEAAKRPGVRAVGVDLDPARIIESRARAREAGVAAKTSFLRQDLFEASIRDATVVILYLGSEVNMRLRPKLFSDLRPGTRIISHLFTMGDWKPDKEVSLWLWEDGLHDLYRWVIPANLAGRWTGTCGKGSCTLTLDQRLDRIRGTLVTDDLLFSLMPAEVRGDTVRLTGVRVEGGQKRTATFEGKMRDGTLEGVIRAYGMPERVWKATRDPSTISWIE